MQHGIVFFYQILLSWGLCFGDDLFFKGIAKCWSKQIKYLCSLCCKLHICESSKSVKPSFKRGSTNNRNLSKQSDNHAHWKTNYILLQKWLLYHLGFKVDNVDEDYKDTSKTHFSIVEPASGAARASPPNPSSPSVIWKCVRTYIIHHRNISVW